MSYFYFFPYYSHSQFLTTSGINVISGIQVKEDGARVEIIGSQKPDFTTFQLSNSRLVLDFSPAKFGKISAKQLIETKFINAVETAAYGMDESAIARIVLILKREIGFDIQVKKITY